MLVAGEIAPEIVLSDSTGVPWQLSEQVVPGPVVLLFYRGHW
jgi:peroxiredoxin